ncbi:hypothetical protein OF897_15345 [Chryseobacterium formosus]|uniref:Lipoprotein n=1 Tax=Chryseobacterium formosus TaxID=1537363 RepID=A0ABT3XUH5_9FLAO|nr:hypothetical protein [Chryseobacterium formosus]MCX8525292.1 hypothetical protein [Chryseobacterium formosus]
MKNISKFIYLFIVLLSLGACKDGTENSIYDGESTAFFIDQFAVAKGPAVGYRDFDIRVGTMSPLGSAATFSISRLSGNAIAGTDYVILNNGSVEIPAGSNSGVIKIRVYGAGLSSTVAKTLVFDLVSPTVPKANYNNTISLSLIFGCDSALAGTYAYSTTNFFTPDTGVVVTTPVTGNVTLGQSSDGVYTITDASFGGYRVLYGGTTIASGVRLQDLCGKLSFLGTNQYGDSFSISNVVVNGDKLTFRWSTSYGEYGTTTLTKTGGNWPALN